MGRPIGSKNKRTGGGTACIVPSIDGGTVSPPDYTDFSTAGSASGGSDSDGGNFSANGTAGGPNSASGEYDIHGNPDRGYGTKPDGSYRQRRPNGTGASGAQAKRKIPLDLKGIEAMLLSIHGMGAMMLKIPELALSEQESAMMAAGIANVAKHYPETGMSEKTLAWVNLGVVMMGVYGTRAVAISNNRKRAKKATQNMQPAANVFTLQPGIEKG